MAVGFMLAHPYGFTRVMSSYHWPRYFENGKVRLNIFFNKREEVIISHKIIYIKYMPPNINIL